MQDKLRAELIGLTNAARLLGVSISELKAAVQTGEPLRGKPAPAPVKRTPNLLFKMGDVMDAAND